MIWSRAESNLGPSTWTGAEASSSRTSKKVQLTARDDSKPSQDDPMDDTSTGQPVARSADDDVTKDPMQVDQPPARVRRVYVAPKYCEPFLGTCPLCQVEYVSGQVMCTIRADTSRCQWTRVARLRARANPIAVLASWRSACKSLQDLGCTAR